MSRAGGGSEGWGEFWTQSPAPPTHRRAQRHPPQLCCSPTGLSVLTVAWAVYSLVSLVHLDFLHSLWSHMTPSGSLVSLLSLFSALSLWTLSLTFHIPHLQTFSLTLDLSVSFWSLSGLADLQSL